MVNAYEMAATVEWLKTTLQDVDLTELEKLQYMVAGAKRFYLGDAFEDIDKSSPGKFYGFPGDEIPIESVTTSDVFACMPYPITLWQGYSPNKDDGSISHRGILVCDRYTEGVKLPTSREIVTFIRIKGTDAWWLDWAVLIVSLGNFTLAQLYEDVKESDTARAAYGDRFHIRDARRRGSDFALYPESEYQRDMDNAWASFAFLAKLMPILNAKRTIRRVTTFDQKSLQRRARDGKKPLLSYYTLHVEIPRKKQSPEIITLKNALSGTRRRGEVIANLAQYIEKPLFGKVYGPIWRQYHWRGNPKKGTIIKDYAMEVRHEPSGP